MIIGRQRKQVITNIKKCLAHRDFHTAVELHDPFLSPDESRRILHRFWLNKSKKPYQFCSKITRFLLRLITLALTSRVQIINDSHAALSQIASAFVTCNHYNQLDILPINKLALREHKRLYFWTEVNNLVMHFPIGLMVRNADVIPVIASVSYLSKVMPLKQKSIFTRHQWILVYPEQALWFNYRKPRPLQRGVYYFAAKMRQPIIPCFAEIRDLKSTEFFHRDFHKTRVILHVLPVIYPDPKLSLNDDVSRMHELDYQEKVAAYEKAYGKKLAYHFTEQDIAGWKNKENQ